MNFSITVKERMADGEVKWEATSSGQTTLFFLFVFFVLFFLEDSSSSLPHQNQRGLPMSLPVPVLSSCQSENGT